eukprot:3754337-Prymnesium_polylepis.1
MCSSGERAKGALRKEEGARKRAGGSRRCTAIAFGNCPGRMVACGDHASAAEKTIAMAKATISVWVGADTTTVLKAPLQSTKLVVVFH